jgi:hypothetical protein
VTSIVWPMPGRVTGRSPSAVPGWTARSSSWMPSAWSACSKLYVALQRYYIRGLTSGVVKG